MPFTHFLASGLISGLMISAAFIITSLSSTGLLAKAVSTQSACQKSLSRITQKVSLKDVDLPPQLTPSIKHKANHKLKHKPKHLLGYKPIAFDQLKVDNYKSDFESAVKKTMQNIKAITDNPSPANFENTIVTFERADAELEEWSLLFFNQLGLQRTEQTQQLAKELSVQLTRVTNDIMLNKKLFQRIQYVKKHPDPNLNTEQKRLLSQTYDQFRRNGALLNTQDKKKLRQLSEQKATLGLQFDDNVLKATNKFLLVVEDENELQGLPQQAIEAARELAKEKQKPGWAFSLHQPSLEPVLKYAQSRPLREKIYRAMESRAFQDEFDNQENILQLVRLRYEMARLLGYKSHADFVLEDRMAKNSQTVNNFLADLSQHVLPAVRQAYEKLKQIAADDGVTDFRPWDQPYYTEKLKQKELDFDSEQLRPYFQLDKVIDGAFATANKLYGLVFQQVDHPVYHKDVRVYEVSDDQGRFMALLYTDFFPREDKGNGAWMTYYKGQKNKYKDRPYVLIAMNFTKPTANTPALLNLREVEILFHEFGHALHEILSCCQYEALSGVRVSWDFVELPSQIMENWVSSVKGLDLFARHYKTDKMIPGDLVNKIQKQKSFLSGFKFLRQLRMATLDMAWHGEDVLDRLEKIKASSPEGSSYVGLFEREVTEDFRLGSYVEPAFNTSAAFRHIFSAAIDYSVSYYSYHWAEVLDADAFELFAEKGVFNPAVAQSFREHILSRGNTEEPDVLYQRFRGRAPNSDALLQRAGLDRAGLDRAGLDRAGLK